MIVLRDYQDKCVNAVRDCFRRLITAVLLVAPTGAGKTVMFAYIAQQAAAKGKRVLIMAHRKELLTQCGNKLVQNGLEFAYIRPRPFVPNYNALVQVGSIQTIVGRMDGMMRWCGTLMKNILWRPDLIIIDEAHRSLAPTYLRILRFWTGAHVLGVTATPVRGDKKALRQIYQEMVVGPSYKELIAERHLKKPLTYRPAEQIDLSGVDEAENETGYNLAQLEAAVDRPLITGSAVAEYQKYCPGVAAVAFCVSIKHSKRVAEEFKAAGYIFEHVDGDMSDTERDGILGRLERGEINGITSVDLVTEGFDAPILQCALMLRPTTNVGLYLQMAGRVLRPYPGQEFAWILDHAGLTKRFGPIDKEREWTLDVPLKKEKKAKGGRYRSTIESQQCPDCLIVHGLENICPECGYEYDYSRRVDEVDGELVPLSTEQRSVIEYETGLLEQLRAIGRRKGYDSSWALNVWAEYNQK